MKSDVYRFAGEVEPPELFISPLTDRGIETIRGEYAHDPDTREVILDAIRPELTDSESIQFADMGERRTPSRERILNEFEDATGGVSPGHPTIKSLEIASETTAESKIGTTSEIIAKKLERFYKLTRMRPRSLATTSPSKEPTWGGDADKFYARVRLPKGNSQMRSLLHELGHCGMPLVGFGKQTSTEVNELQFSTRIDWIPVAHGLTYKAEDDGDGKGMILEEAVAEGLGSLANRKLGLVKTRYNDETQEVPEVVAPYMVGKSFSGSAPSAVALELIARELDIPPERYFKMFVDYANVGVLDADARQEVAETVYKGTRGKLTLGQVEELPYPIHKEASLALLWAVEDALDVPDHKRYADVFFSQSTNKS